MAKLQKGGMRKQLQRGCATPCNPLQFSLNNDFSLKKNKKIKRRTV
jgi:hypothetical protein